MKPFLRFSGIFIFLVQLCLPILGIDEDYTNQNETQLHGRFLEIGDYSVVYVHVSHLDNTTSNEKGVFFPIVDRMSRLEIDDSRYLIDDPTVNVRVCINESCSTVKQFSTGTAFVAYWTVIIEMLQGSILGVQWDEDCSDCIASNCLDGNCAIPITSVDPPCDDTWSSEAMNLLVNDPNRCGIKLYLAWIGSDRNGHMCKSVGSIPSSFKKYSFAMNLYDMAAGFWNDFMPF